jgi:signal transduction histidine kinase
MEIWMTAAKVILVLYLIISYAGSELKEGPWFVFFILIYFSMNITVYILKNTKVRTVLHMALIFLILVAQYSVYPLLIILLSINVFELGRLYKKEKLLMLLLTMTPLFYLHHSVFTVYFLATTLCYMVYVAIDLFSERLNQLREQNDAMRKDIQRLVNRLSSNEEYLRQSEYTYRLEERNRISQEIHDQIGHAMTSALIQMEASKRLMETGDTDQAVSLLQNAIQISKAGIERIRVTLKNMKPAKEQMGINRIKLMASEFASKHHIAVPLTHKGNLDVITPLQWKVLYENASEALTNVLKYADATMVSIEIHVFNKFIKMVIKDNGKGAEKIKRGLGIIGMEERTAALNGQIITDGSNGFSVTTLLPIDEVSHKKI